MQTQMCVCVCTHICLHVHMYAYGLPWWLSGKESACNAGATETQVQSLCWEDPLEEGMETLSSILAWRISWTGEPGRL